MTEPIADVKESASRGKLIACGDVAVRENEVFHVYGLQQLSGELHLALVFPFEDEHALIVGVAAFFRKEA